MPRVSFNGEARLIVVDVGESSISTRIDLYSDWKEWALSSDNLKYGEVLRTIGGDPLGGGLFAGDYYFLQNQDIDTPSATSLTGWRIRPAESAGELVINGNMFGEDVTLPTVIPTVGTLTVLVRLNTSQLTQSIETGALTATELAAVCAIASAVSVQTSAISSLASTVVSTASEVLLAVSTLVSSVSAFSVELSAQGGALSDVDTRTLTMYRYWGLEPGATLTVCATYLSVAGVGIDQVLSTAAGTTTAERQ